MKLTEVIVRRPVAAIMIIAAVVIFGASALLSMPQELTPEMELPVLLISTIYPGAGPEDVENLVTREIEGSVNSLSGVKTVASYSMENISLTMIQYEYGTNMDTAYTDTKEKLDRLANTLPDDARAPIVMELDMNAMASMYLSVSSNAKDDLLYYVEDNIVPELERLSTVAEVSVSGGLEQYVRVELKEEMLQQYGLAMPAVTESVKTADFSMPLGSADYGNKSLAVRTEVEYETVDALKNIPVSLGNGGIIRLADVADVYITTKDATSISRYNGEDNIGLSISKRQSASAVNVAKQVNRITEQLMAEDPDIHIAVVYDASEQISSSINSIASTMVMAVILSMLVLYVFLGDLRASLIVGSSMPVSLLVTFIFMNFMGYSLNIVSMSGLVLGVGMMVDNSIVVLDSCFKSNTQTTDGKKDYINAAIQGTKFVFLSVLAGTITTVVVFLPLAMIEGMSGQLFGPLGFAIVFALAASLFSAITLVPLFFTRFQPQERRNAPAAKLLKRVERVYGRMLKKILKKKKTVFALTMAFLVFSIFIATRLNVELMPSSDEGIIDITVETVPGLKLERIDEVMTGLEEMVAAHPDVEHYTLSAGGTSLTGTNSSSLTAYLHKKKDRDMDTVEVVEQWRQQTKNLKDCDIDISSSSSSMSMSGGDGIDIRLVGNNFDRLREASTIIEEVVGQHPDIIRVSSTTSTTDPQIEIVVDPLKAASKNMTPAAISQIIYTALNGTEAATLQIDNKDYSIYVEYPQGKYENIGDIENMLISAGGAGIPLTEVAEVKFTNTPQTITRQNSEYIVTVTATPTNAAKYTAQAELLAMISEVRLPDGVSLGRNSQSESMEEEFTSLATAILTAILLVFMVMAIQFESVKHSLMVMVCIPFSMIGSFSFLYIFNATISMVSILGFLILVGTVVNNGILFVDTTNQYRKSMDLETALITAGRTRMRPILMTTLTTILSMIPLASGIGEGTEMMVGLGMVVIGGLTASTILTLILLPTFYLIIDGNPDKKKRRAEKRELRKAKRHPVTE